MWRHRTAEWYRYKVHPLIFVQLGYMCSSLQACSKAVWFVKYGYQSLVAYLASTIACPLKRRLVTSVHRIFTWMASILYSLYSVLKWIVYDNSFWMLLEMCSCYVMLYLNSDLSLIVQPGLSSSVGNLVADLILENSEAWASWDIAPAFSYTVWPQKLSWGLFEDEC